MKRRDLIKLFYLSSISLGLTTCQKSPSLFQPKNQNISSDRRLTIWAARGYYPEETDALKTVINQWQDRSNLAVELKLLPEKDIPKTLEIALAAGNPPDILVAGLADEIIIPQLAWKNELEDVTDVLESVKQLYSESVLQSVFYQNKIANKRSFYAFPLMQWSTHIHCWQDLLASIERNITAIPQDWRGFWRFWQRSQAQLRQQGNPEIYGVGLPMSLCADTFTIFEQFLEAYDVQILDANGRHLLERSRVKQGIAEALADYTQFYQQQYVSPNAIDWEDADNNVSILSRISLMTVNPSMSIPGSQRKETDIYHQKLVTLPWPNKPNGQPMRSISLIKQAIIPAAAKQKQAAKDFMTYFLQPERLSPYIQGSQGRFFPVMPSLLAGDFWQNPQDPHIAIAAQQYQTTRPAYQVFNPAYSQVQLDNVWGRVIRQIATAGWSAQKAAKEAIEQIQNILNRWY